MAVQYKKFYISITDINGAKCCPDAFCHAQDLGEALDGAGHTWNVLCSNRVEGFSENEPHNLQVTYKEDSDATSRRLEIAPVA
jgi:hypothetical protein